MKTALVVMKGIEKSVPSLKSLVGIIVITLGRMMFVDGVRRNGGSMKKQPEKIKREDFIEMTQWVIDCPICANDIILEGDPNYEDDCYCDNCKEVFKLEG